MDQLIAQILERIIKLENRAIDLEKIVSDWQCIALLALCESRDLKSYIETDQKFSEDELVRWDQLQIELADGHIDDILMKLADNGQMKEASFVKQKINELRKKKST